MRCSMTSILSFSQICCKMDVCVFWQEVIFVLDLFCVCRLEVEVATFLTNQSNMSCDNTLSAQGCCLSLHPCHLLLSVLLCDAMWVFLLLCDAMWMFVLRCDAMWMFVLLCDVMWICVLLCDAMWVFVLLCDAMWVFALLCECVSVWRCVNAWCYVNLCVLLCDAMWICVLR